MIEADVLATVNIATILAALLVMVVVAVFAITTVRSVKLEFRKVKDALGQVAAGNFNEQEMQANFKESAEVLSYIERLAHNIQRQREAVAILAFSDHLTSLANRMRFEDELARGFNFAKRGLSLGVVVLNITNFRKLNDRGGRAMGDHLLKVLASVLRQSVRKTDLAARFESDEFGLVLANMETGRVVAWLEELQTRFRDAQTSDEMLKLYDPLTLRFGYSFVSEVIDKDPQAVLERATSALAQATPESKTNIIGA